MSKPERFAHLFFTQRNLPYQCTDEKWQGLSMTGGVLGKGTNVWTESPLTTRPSTVPAWVEDLGIVHVDGRCLCPGPRPALPRRMTQLPFPSETATLPVLSTRP